VLRVRWLGKVRYADAHALQSALWERSADDYLLLLEHPHVYTLGVRADLSHVLVDPATVGAELVRTNRGGDVTYHGPGQLVGYPILSLADGVGTMPDTPAYVRAVEQVVIDGLGDVGLADVGRLEGCPGVWVQPRGPEPRKICAVGVRLSKGRSMHGFALNVDPDMSMFAHIVPCGITDHGVTSLAAEGLHTTMREVADAIVARAVSRWADPGAATVERTDVAWRVATEELSLFTRGAGPGAVAEGASAVRARPGGGSSVGVPVRLRGRLTEAGVDAEAGLATNVRKPEWLRVKADMGQGYRDLKRTMRSLDLVTVCEEAGCPNIFECWADGTATFMINGERCTRACGFCLVDTRHPMPLDPGEPERVAEAVARMGLSHAVVTAVARDDLPDGGAAGFALTVGAIRRRCPGTTVETLISDCQGQPEALERIFAARPDVLNHNLETVARLQRAVRPSAGYARSLAVLARAKSAGLTTKSGLILGMGETDDEVLAALTDLRAVGVDIVTIGQYLRPTSHHLPVDRWVEPGTFAELGAAADRLGFAHVESSPLTRSSYHAKRAVDGAMAPAGPGRGTGLVAVGMAVPAGAATAAGMGAGAAEDGVGQ
jgi:lipoic acid synthetase